jgi:hypothetical protein
LFGCGIVAAKHFYPFVLARNLAETDRSMRLRLHIGPMPAVRARFWVGHEAKGQFLAI